MEEPSITSPPEHDVTIRKIAAFDARLQCYTPQYTFLLGYLLTNIFLFFYGAVPEHSNWPQDLYRAWFISIARGFGSTLNFNIALQMILACRNFLTFLRRTRLSLLFPLDQAMPEMHTIVAIISLIAAILHSIFHCIPFFRTPLWSTGFGEWTHLFVIGVLLILTFSAVVITSIPIVRKRSYEVFSAFHLIGTAILLSLLLFHGLHKGQLSTYKWILGPSLLYFLDRISVMMTVKTASVKVKIGSECKHLLYDGGIVKLRFKKPFQYRAGQYAHLCIPLISKTQWHPFTFASAPYEGKVLFFIKCKGNWTEALHDICKTGLDRRTGKPVFKFEVKIRGPYGSSAEHASQYHKVLLISGGVGATPFCSLTKEMTNDFLETMKERAESGEIHTDSSSDEPEIARRPNSSLNERVSDLYNAGMSALPNGLSKPKKKIHSISSAGAIYLRTSRHNKARRKDDGFDQESNVRSQTWAQFFYTISSTATFNTSMLWLLMVRLFVAIMSVAFGFSDLSREGSEIFRSTGVTVVDLCLASLFLVGLCSAIISEIASENRMFAEEVLISLPLAVVPVVSDVVTLLGRGTENGKLTLYYFAIVWPMTILSFLLRYFRTLRGKALLPGTVKEVHEPCTSVDFIWTTRTREEDVWLMEELCRTVGKTRFVRLHRFITREQEEDAEAGGFKRRGISKMFVNRDDLVGDHYGRPVWDDIFNKLTCNIRNGSTVGIFFCGPAEMAAAVKQAATLSMFDSRYRGISKNGERGRNEDSLARSFNVRYVFRQEQF